MYRQPQTVAHAMGGEQQGETVLRTIKLSKTYGQRVVVDHLNLTLKRGEILGFLGANGAGKTTTIRMIMYQAGAVDQRGEHRRTDRAKWSP